MRPPQAPSTTLAPAPTSPTSPVPVVPPMSPLSSSALIRPSASRAEHSSAPPAPTSPTTPHEPPSLSKQSQMQLHRNPPPLALSPPASKTPSPSLAPSSSLPAVAAPSPPSAPCSPSPAGPPPRSLSSPRTPAARIAASLALPPAIVRARPEASIARFNARRGALARPHARLPLRLHQDAAEQLRALADEVAKDATERFRRKWGFDVEKDEPVDWDSKDEGEGSHVVEVECENGRKWTWSKLST